MLYNKLNDRTYFSGVVGLSRYRLNEHEESLLAYGLGFCPLLDPQTEALLFLDLEDIKRTRLHLSFTDLTILEGPLVHPLQRIISHINLSRTILVSIL